ncbi:STAS domain-containing protein [Aquabacterium sp. OR-4]|uniref:STAS domain-containing protein n=1 Tax=Aquabacterium sp. OR-4 TaxID=2978127 RepID=UPI0021B31806|nr:hypothetical protein [Aquabacterium sp. OR-4]MDT7834312.1 hypothetical protein [Aquabacterium sp. OR-4]
MAEPKDNESFFRKVVRFVANPATDWNELATRQDDSLDLEKSELKAMIERKKRNDFVRKREFDTLRRLRRDGLSPEQLAALGGSSRVDDSEGRLSEPAALGVKAKIDEIEQQMVGEAQGPLSQRAMGVVAPPIPARRPAADAPRRAPAPPLPSGFHTAPTEPQAFDTLPPAPGNGALSGLPLSGLDSMPPLPDLGTAPTAPAELSSLGGMPQRDLPRPAMPPDRPTDRSAMRHAAASSPASFDASRTTASRRPPAPAMGLGGPAGDDPAAHSLTGVPPRRAVVETALSSKFVVEVSELVHDPELDEAVIAFANADFEHCEQSLTTLCRLHGPRRQHAETWHVLFDLYRATGQQAKFEALVPDYVNLFGRSPPQWFSLPKLVADAAADERPDTRGVQGDVGWVSPAMLDDEGVARLRSATLQLPLPWVLDWQALERVEIGAAVHLQQLLRQWAPQPLDMRWLGADRLFAALQEAAPTGVRDADPAYWMARLEALRLVNRPDQFDETAIDYCVTYEVSPPSWERARCAVRCVGSGHSTTAPPLSIVTEVQSSFFESRLTDETQGPQRATVELSGQLVGDIGHTLQQLDQRLGQDRLVTVSCARLIRVDFIAAGDLLNWVLSKQGEQRNVTFAEAHRLVALFFGAMGINEHARVQVPRN